ncbi:MAG: hypothetical protein BGO70_02785 [Bacteroidetes bacterium 43-93]|nr:hypothetical protein [Bacteroidota bacterium]OJX00712.1 MAG: hypothetical protein BGO70_02785 [Bacteroidetes bacterium 43-93]
MLRLSLFSTLFFSTFLLYPAQSFAAKKYYRPQKHRVIHLTPADKTVDIVITTDPRKHTDRSKFYYWYKDGTLGKTQGAYSGYLLDGEYTEAAYPEKSMICKGHYSLGLKDGSWTEWYPDGRIRISENWKNGLLNGRRYVLGNTGDTIKNEYYHKGSMHIKTADSSVHHKTLHERWNNTLAYLHLKKKTAGTQKK